MQEEPLIYKMLRLFCVVVSLLWVSTSHAKQNTQKLPPEASPKAFAQVAIIDKTYTQTITTTVPIAEALFYKDLAVTIEKCQKNKQDQTFALVKITRGGNILWHAYLSVDETSPSIFTHHYYDVSVLSCTKNLST